ncbi:MAG: AraC family transcriptional regulator [Sandaracinaceae bacterium]|nr:AraC family transcriptional regulator [Myxococcales bacterium]
MEHERETKRDGAVFVMHDTVARYDSHAEASHTEHGLTYLMDGWLRMEHGGPVEAVAGTFTVVPAGVPHRPLEGRDMDYWLVGFCATCLGLDESQPLMSPFRRVRRGALPVLTVAKSRRRRVVRLYRELREEQARGAPESPELVRSLVLLLLGEARRAMPAMPGDAPRAAAGSLVADALETIQRRCLEPISLRDVAAEVHRSAAHVASTVKNETGYSVGEWIAAGRVAEAAARLAHTDDPLDAIAEHVGWRDKTHFIRQFKKAYGVTPAAWRRAQRAAHER